jgi:hypothetical protein
MSYEKSIEVYRFKENIVTPLASNPDKNADCGLGDLVLIIDRDVWVRDWNAEREEQFAKAIYGPEFVRINPQIFDKL